MKLTTEELKANRKETLKRWYSKRKNDPIFIKKRNDLCTSWRERNPEKIKDYSAEYYKENKETLLAKTREWEKKNPFIVRKYWIEKRTGQPIEAVLIQTIYEENIKKFGTLTCYLCIKPILFGEDCIEHKIPSKRGGNNSKENLAIAHISCNSKKRDFTDKEYFNAYK